MSAPGTTWVITYRSLPQIQPPNQKRILIHATSIHDAWNQAEWRLGDLSPVVSVKPLSEIMEATP